MDAFDPYHKWLGIPPADQPPHHYRLLAINLFESDADVIDMAADRQMAFLKQFANGPNVAQSQRLLNEIAAARLCLLKPGSKSAYDAELKKKFAADTLVSASETAGTAKTGNCPAPETPERSVARRKRLLWMGGGAVVGLILLAGLVISKTKEGSSVAIVEKPVTPAKRVPKKEKPVSTAKGWHGWPADAPPPAIAPFDDVTAKKHQTAWAKYLKRGIEYTNTIGMRFILIPPGEFTMGSTPAEIEESINFLDVKSKHWESRIKSEAPQHKVILTEPIYVGVHEVTQSAYEKVIGKNPSAFSPTGELKAAALRIDTANHPVEMVSWNDAAEFCAKLSQLEKLKPFYFRAGETVTPLEGSGYRLLTEAEWEFACRAGTVTKYWGGDQDVDLMRADWVRLNSGGQTHEVARLVSNPFGLHDVHGNVWEWVQDLWEPDYYAQFQDKPALNPRGPATIGSHRVMRGAYCTNAAYYCRSSHRGSNDRTTRGDFIGFRVALAVAGPRVSRR